MAESQAGPEAEQQTPPNGCTSENAIEAKNRGENGAKDEEKWGWWRAFGALRNGPTGVWVRDSTRWYSPADKTGAEPRIGGIAEWGGGAKHRATRWHNALPFLIQHTLHNAQTR